MVVLTVELLSLLVVAMPAVAYGNAGGGAVRIAVEALVVAMIAAMPIIARRKGRRSPTVFCAALLFAALTPLAGDHARGWPARTSDAFSAARDLNVLMPALLVGGVGVLASRTRRFVRRAIVFVAAACMIATVAGAPGDLRVLAIPFWWHVPAGVRVIGRMVARPRVPALSRAIAACAIVVAVGYGWTALKHWMSGVGIAIAPLLADG